MKVLDSFTQQHIQEVLQNTFSNKSQITFSINKCPYSENFTLLNLESDGVKEKYVLVKVPEDLEAHESRNLKKSNVVNPVFVIENKNKETYGAFESLHGMEHFVSPEHNNTECLKMILKALAEDQALDLVNGKEGNENSEVNFKEVIDKVTSLHFFNDLDKATIIESMKTLELAVKKIFESDMLVKSIGCPLASNVYVNQGTSQSIFLNVASKKLLPPSYDALLYIFALSNEKFRQEHFEDLVLYYFDSLKEFLQKLQGADVAEKITNRYRDHHVKVLLPVVKFQIAHSLLELEKSIKLQEVLLNLFYFLKYPLINQEDIYETTKTKLGSSNYNLLDYALVCLNEKNGHLGEYFHLDIKVRVEEKEQELQLFAKFLKTTTDLMQELIDSGPAKKEDFFYNTLLPLYVEHGMESLLDFSSRCYLSRDNLFIVLDDFSRRGYVSLKPNVVLNYEGLRATVENLAKFHASTIILEEILSEKSGKIVRLDDDYGEFLQETLLIYEEGSPFKQMYDQNLEALYRIVEKCPEITKNINLSPEEIKSQLKSAYLTTFLKIKKSDTIRNVVNHGDMYVGNMLFKFDDNKLITYGVLIDFQIIRYISPTYDLLFFLFENSSKDTRDKYLRTLIEDYYQYISENIRKFNFDPEVVFPKKTFDIDINHMMSAGIMGAFMYANLVHIDSDFREEIFEDQEKFDYYMQKHKAELVDLGWECDHYRTILTGLVKDMIDIIIT